MTTKKEKRPHLGRGLESLIGSTAQPLRPHAGQEAEQSKFPPDSRLKQSIREVAVGSIEPNPYQPRTKWDQEQLEELANSIRENGIIQPILLRETGHGYQVIAGERRLRAAEIIGLEKVPAIVRQADDSEMMELALIENIHRSDLNPLERAQAYQHYIETFGLNQTDAAKRLGEDRSVLANHLRLLGLHRDIKRMISDKILSMGHARALLGLENDQQRLKVSRIIEKNGLSVRETENMVRNIVKGVPKMEKPEKPAHIMDIENRLKECLGTKVTVDARKNGQRGKIIIEFYSLDDFDRLSEKIGLETSEG